MSVLQGLVAGLNSERNADWLVSEVHWKEYKAGNTYNDSDWLSVGVVEPGSIAPSFQRGLFDFEAGLPRQLKASVVNRIGAEIVAQLAEINFRNIELVHAGARLAVRFPRTMDEVTAGAENTTTVVKVSVAAQNFVAGKPVSVRRMAGTGFENRTINSIDTGTPTITVDSALGAAAAAGDSVRQGVWQEVNASPSPTTTQFALDDASLFAESDEVLVLKKTGTTVASSSNNTRSQLVLTDATGFASGDYIEVQDDSSNLAEYTRISSLSGTLAQLDPGLTFTPDNLDQVRLVRGFSRIKTVSGNTLTLSDPLASVPAADDPVGRIDAINVVNGTTRLREVSLRVIATPADSAKQFVWFFPRIRLEQTASAVKFPETTKNWSAELRGKAIAGSYTFGSSTVLRAASLFILRGSQRLST